MPCFYMVGVLPSARQWQVFVVLANFSSYGCSTRQFKTSG
uniref:Uncharacterized protein n=1 Tax=Rhizophora mucronata TaxID=61149 RepID=A0A2P2QNR9_RHIMU